MKKSRPFARAVLAAALALGTAAWPAAPAALADDAGVESTYTVNNTGDAGDASPGNNVCATSGGVCTLRAAVQEANAHAGADTITVPAMTVVLGSELKVTQNLTINGAGQGSTILDGNNATRVLNFDYYSGTHVVSNLTIRNANYTGSGFLTGGGGIFNAGHLTVTNVTLTNNRANQGGGIYNMLDYIGGDGSLNVPSLALNTVVFTNNTATSATLGQGGGGLYNGSALDAQNVSLTGNSAYQGGGVYNNNPHNQGAVYQVLLNNFVISNNSAKYGGGLNNDVGDMTLSNGALSNNTVSCCGPNNAHTGGGGIYNWKTMIMTNVTVSGNRAAYGAGIQNGNFDNQANSMVMTNVTVSSNLGTSNTYQTYAGGILNTGNGQLSMTNSTVALNSASYAGGIDTLLNRTTATVTMHNSIIGSNTGSLGNPDCRGTLGTTGNNLISNTSGCTFSPAAGDQVNVSPALGPLQNNGGSTLTHALISGSPAIDRGTNSGCPAADQRGVSRPINGDGVGAAVCDIGAFEAQSAQQANFRVFIPLVDR